MNLRALTLLTAIAIVLSGCVGGSGAGKTTSAPPPAAPAPTVTDDTGSIAGKVVDDESKPLPGADVGLDAASGLQAESDANGLFTINHLAPGEHNVIVQKLGYESVAKRVTVAAAATTDVTFVLASIAINDEPRTEYQTYEGFIAGPSLYTIAVTYRAVNTFPINLTKGADEVVLSMAWLANAPTLARYMYQSVALGENRNSTYGKSPLSIKISELEVEKAKDKATVSWYLHFACLLGVSPQGAQDYATCVSQNPEAAIPVVAYQQRVTHYSSVFYNQVAPEGYTGLPA